MADYPSSNVFAFEEKWGEQIAKHHFTCVPNLLLFNTKALKITPSEFLLLMILESYRYTVDSLPWPSIETLSHFMGCRERSVTRLLTSLENKGLIKRYYRRNKSNIYDSSLLALKLDKISHIPVQKGRKRRVGSDINVHKRRP